MAEVMAILSPTFIFGIVVLLYLSSFIVFAILRIVTGISIQRIGYFSLRRLTYTPKDGVKIEIRGLGINLHRPTFAQPTWLSVVLTELAVTVDLKVLGGEDNDEVGKPNGNADDARDYGLESPDRQSFPRDNRIGLKRSKSWERLTILKERIKRLHRKINWIRMVDVVAINSLITVAGVGSIQVGSYTMAVDTRRKTVDHGRMFYRKKDKKEQRPAEWMLTLRSVLFTPEGSESLEVLDHVTLNIHGLLYKELDGLRDAAIALKLGRVHIPYDDILTCISRYKSCRRPSRVEKEDSNSGEISVADIEVELDQPGSRDDLAQTVSDSKEFVSSILRGIKEVQFAVSYMGMTKRIHVFQSTGPPIYINASMKEVGVDLHRLDPKSPAHRMYFSSKDIAHQALVAALSIAVGVNDGQGKSDRLVYIPMATTTVRTTLPSKTVEFAEDRSADERNANILFANVVITSPSVDLDPKHLPLVVAVMQTKPKIKPQSSEGKRVLISRLLPKAYAKFSMHEPVVRISLPPVDPSAGDDDFDLIISSISSVSLDVESSHSAVGQLHYSLASTFRVQSHDLYYQTSSAVRYQLLQTESMELKVQVVANPDVQVAASGSLQTFSVHMVRPEISDGVRQIVRQLRIDVEPDKKTSIRVSSDPNFIRALPAWLLHFQFQASDFSAEVAGIDSDISNDTRGLALQVESWTAEYRAQRLDPTERKQLRRRTGSKSLTPDTELLKSIPESPRKKQQHATDGRRLAIHIRGLEGFVVEAAEKWEVEPFLAMPRFEIALSTSSDNQGSIFHINSHIKTLLIHYSLYRHYAVGVATMVLKGVFLGIKAGRDHVAQLNTATAGTLNSSDLLSPGHYPQRPDTHDMASYPVAVREVVTIDVKVTLVQFKALMPADPPLMIQIYGLEAGRHRWSSPFFYLKLVRLYAEAPKMRRVWARIVSVKAARVDLRESMRKMASGEYLNEKVIDINSEAIRLAVPHQLVLHKVFDNVINTIKATEQLHHRFKTEANVHILEKTPQGPKQVPKISVRSRALLFELEDGAFEWKLGTIYRTGIVEQQQRLAREEAFKLKAKKIEEEEQRRGPPRYRNRSAHPRSRNNQQNAPHQRNKSDEEQSPTRGRPRSDRRSWRIRYDPEGMCGISGTAKISIKEAYEKMQQYNAQSWKMRIDYSYKTQKSGMRDLRGVFWGLDQLPEEMEDTENILEVPQRPALMSTLISDLHITIDKPSFPLSQLPEYLHRIGKGMPYDMKYALLIPMHVQIDMGDARMTLRDYPLPLLHVPALKPGQSPRLPSWSLKTDFVIAEEFRGPQSTRHVRVNIIPPKDAQENASNEGCFAIDVRRTISPVKSYSDISIDINTGLPTRITWGASYQPAIQDMMMVFEGFTRPQADPSDRTGFWDKIRLSFHSRASIAWKGDGDVHLMLKGTRDPYAITGNGAGFLMCWRNDVRWGIWRDAEPRKFMTVDSGDYILAIPDYSYQARGDDKSSRDGDGMSSADSYKNGTIFKKVVMKLSGNVQWLAGIVFERNIANGKRSFEFEPHYNVILKEPSFAEATPGQEYDAFRGFRSQHIHLSIAVKAPVDRDWSITNSTPSRSYNTVHLTPRFFTHFFAWWSMFGGPMSLPIRQGRLWPGIEKSSKKFGRHLATIKYNLLLAPLFLSHIYKHKEAGDYSEDNVSATGLKIRLDSFMLDMHQRREEFNTQDKGRKAQSKTTGMKIHKAQLDLLSADIRAISASIASTTPEDLRKASVPTLMAHRDGGLADPSRFTIPDNDFSWIDMDDFVELDWILPSEANPDTKIMPLAFAPRFTYFRQTDHWNTIAGDPDRKSLFGNEPTHFCIMSEDDDPRRVQRQLIQERLKQLDAQKVDHQRNLGEAELRSIRDDGKNENSRTEYEQLQGYASLLRDKQLFLELMMREMAMRIRTSSRGVVHGESVDNSVFAETPASKNIGSDAESTNTAPTADFISDFSNRFVIHNMQMKWNNSLRNTLLRYIHQVGQRRGFVYYLSRRAVKFILDIVEEQHRAKAPKTSSPTQVSSPLNMPPSTAQVEIDTEVDVEYRIREILADGKNFVTANDPQDQEVMTKISTELLSSNIGEDFTPQNSYHLRLIAPQIQLQSERNPKSVVLVTAKGMELKVVEVMDKDRMFDEVSGLVQRRFSVEMDSTQFFVTHQKWFSSQLLSMYSGSHYGTPADLAWPPWVPMEVMFDFEVDPFGFKRVVQKTSASLRYDKYNTLRLKYNDEVGGDGKHATTPENVESRMDHLWVEFPHIRAICDSSQYYAMYIIVLDLLLYNEPLEKTRSERLEKIMLASDFSDLRGAPEMVVRLQERIRQLEEIKTQFHIHSNYLDKKGWNDRILLEQDLANCEDELFFMMKAITTSQRKYDGSQNNGLLRWNISSKQIVWHLTDKGQPLVEFQLQDAEYDRTDNSDGSHTNLVQIGKIVGLNLLSDAIYPEMIARYVDPERSEFYKGGNKQMLRVYWYMLEAIAGIPVMDHFEVNLFPMKIQLEHEVGKRLFEYIFPGSDEKASLGSGKSSIINTTHTHLVQDDDGEGDSRMTSTTNSIQTIDADKQDTPRAGSLELRLRPTMSSESRPKANTFHKSKTFNTHSSPSVEGSHFRLFPSSKSLSSQKPPSIRAVNKKPSLESLLKNGTTRPLTGRSTTNLSTMDGSSTNSDGKNRRFGLHRNMKQAQDARKPSDDLTKMMSRASNYMTLAYVKIPSVVLCLSYKGKGDRNIEDVHNFVFRMPMLEYRNKTWSNLDLALALKKAVIKALISHTGAIIGNKFSKHRPNNAQQTRLGEPNNSDTSSVFGTSPSESRRSERSKSPRRSFASNSSGLARSASASSIHSANSLRNEPSLPASMVMTPAAPPNRSGGTSNQDVIEDEHAWDDKDYYSNSNAFHAGDDDDSQGRSLKSDTAVGRRLYAFGSRMRDRTERTTTTGDDGEENSRRKSKLLLGKKILGGIGDR
jgi:Mitochondrial protein from FMP27/Golgi-body localisation protein domain/RNA pol II promoter Fmp27 protein domain/Domain of unknown function (DUF2405)